MRGVDGARRRLFLVNLEGTKGSMVKERNRAMEKREKTKSVPDRKGKRKGMSKEKVEEKKSSGSSGTKVRVREKERSGRHRGVE